MTLKNIPKKILILAILLCLFNLFDAGATTFIVVTGIGYEVNPAMAWLLKQGLWAFWIFKIFIATVIPYFFAVTHEYKLARLGLWVGVIPYAILCLYYVIGFANYFLF